MGASAHSWEDANVPLVEGEVGAAGEVGVEVLSTIAAPRSARPDDSSGSARKAESEIPTSRRGCCVRWYHRPVLCRRM